MKEQFGTIGIHFHYFYNKGTFWEEGLMPA